MYKLTVDYETLFNKLSNNSNKIDSPIEVTKKIYVKTPDGFSLINQVVKKSKQPIIRVLFENNHYFECSTGHLFCCNGKPIKSELAEIVDTLTGSIKIIEKNIIGEEEVYDISIDSPHWYLHDSENTIIHHNTFFTLAAVKNYLDAYPDGVVVYFETENALTKEILECRNIDLSRFIHMPVATVQDFKNQALRIVDEKLKENDSLPLLFILDSLGNLSTTKEMEDSVAGNEAKDMTRAQIIKAAFRVLSLKMGAAGIPMIFTNHVYAKIGCAEKGTKVKTLNGDKNIEDVKVGEQVLTLVGNKEVTNIFSYSSNYVYEIEFDDHTKLVLTEEDVIVSAF